MIENAAFPFVVGTTGGSQEFGHVGGSLRDCSLVDELAGCLQWTNAVLSVVGLVLLFAHFIVPIQEKQLVDINDRHCGRREETTTGQLCSVHRLNVDHRLALEAILQIWTYIHARVSAQIGLRRKQRVK